MTDHWLTIDELAERLNVKRSWVRDKVTARQLPHHRPGCVRFSPEDVAEIEALLKEPVAGAPSALRLITATHPPAGPSTPPPPPGPRDVPAPARRKAS